MKYSLKDAVKFERYNKKECIYNTTDDFQNANVVLLKLMGSHGKIRNEKSDKVYFILKGSFEFITKDKKYVATKSDVVIVPQDTPYDFRPKDKKKVECLLINCPSFDRNAEFKLQRFAYHKAIFKFTLSKAEGISWDGWRGLAYNSKEDFSRISALYIEVTKRHGLSKTTISDRVYYILKGKGEFIVKDDKYEVSETDVIIIPKNTPYDYESKGKDALKMFMIHVPAFDPKYVVELE